MTRTVKYRVRLPGKRDVSVPAPDIGPSAQALLHINDRGQAFVVEIAAAVQPGGPGFAITQAVREK